MTKRSYVLRGTLYFLIAFLPTLAAGIEANKPPLLIGIAALVAGLTAIRAFIDKSPSGYADAKDAADASADA